MNCLIRLFVFKKHCPSFKTRASYEQKSCASFRDLKVVYTFFQRKQHRIHLLKSTKLCRIYIEYEGCCCARRC